jgi:hypothetical protein
VLDPRINKIVGLYRLRVKPCENWKCFLGRLVGRNTNLSLVPVVLEKSYILSSEGNET